MDRSIRGFDPRQFDTDWQLWRRRLGHPLKNAEQLRRRLFHIRPAISVSIVKRSEKCHEARSAVGIGWGEIGPAVERTQFRREKYAHGPSSLPGEDLHRGHVQLIDVGSLFAIDLDIDESPVHFVGHGFIFEALSLHDMAPITGAVADGEKDRFVLPTRGVERFRAPRVPIDRVMPVLQQVWG